MDAETCMKFFFMHFFTADTGQALFAFDSLKIGACSLAARTASSKLGLIDSILTSVFFNLHMYLCWI